MGASHTELIDRWPSLRAFGADLGVEYNTAKHIRRRGVIPSPYWTRVVAGAAARQIPGVTLDVLAAAVARTEAAGPTPSAAAAA